MMNTYDKYKDSGIEWIGKIPEHWNLKKIKHTTYVKGRIGWKGLRSDEFLELSDSYVVTGTDFENGRIKWETCYQVPLDRYEDDPFIKLKNEDLLITKDGTIGKIALVRDMPKIATLNSGVFLTRPYNGEYSQEFMYWILFSEVFKTFYDYNKSGSTIQHLYQNVFNEFEYPFPPPSEQNKIAKYLKYKTTQINALITKKEQFITLLQEERSAVINQAVTKGLDPKVKMKDSGIEWLGEIPEHWEVKRLRNLVETIKTGSTPPSEEIQYFEPNEINWYGPGDFDSLILGNSKRKISKLAIEENKCRLFPANSILLIGIGATVGKVGLTLEDCSSNQQLNAIILKNGYNSIFYLYFLSTIKDIIIMEASSATLPIFNQTQTKNIITPVPPAKEQVEIANFIAKKELEIKNIISKTKQEIELLKEYKTSLISEVITGKVDVRDVVLN